MQQAADALDNYGTIVAHSPIIETPPFGIANQPFLNQVVVLESSLAPPNLLDSIKQIEQELGRQPRPRWDNREIDIDILLWDGEQIDTVTAAGNQLTIPHPGLPDRQFLHQLLAEVPAPYTYEFEHDWIIYLQDTAGDRPWAKPRRVTRHPSSSGSQLWKTIRWV